MNTSLLDTIEGNESSSLTTVSVASIGRHGGPVFDLEDGMVVPYIPPSDMGLSYPTGGEHPLSFTKPANGESKAIMIFNTALINQAHTTKFLPRSIINALIVKPTMIDGPRTWRFAHIFGIGETSELMLIKPRPRKRLQFSSSPTNHHGGIFQSFSRC